ncbi:MAG: electron transport complex subunit RsxC [Clostridiales bacterium]|nr:electron transport complex subunit RsxC [Candidatus Equinaster intestinalis]
MWGGVKLDHKKHTANKESTPIPTPEAVYIPLKQNIGRACDCLVKVGDTVKVGTKIGDSEEFLTSPIYASISGTVKAITEKDGVKSVEIESDGLMTREEFTPPVVETVADLIRASKEAGLVGLGGAGFPMHVKLGTSVDKGADTLIVNAAECEPYITSDHRTCLENFNDVIDGIYLLKRLLSLKEVIIAVEANKPDVIEKLYEIATDKEDVDNSVRLMKLKTTYPQGAEKMIIYTATGKIVPAGKLPADVGVIVMNVTSIAMLNKYVRTGEPLVSRCITVSGRAIRDPKNVIVPIGTKIKDVLAACDVKDNIVKVISGGPMMGMAVATTDQVITKQNNAIVAFESLPVVKTTPCIRCGRCVMACPMNLRPADTERALNFGKTDTLAKLNVDYCMECGCCSFTCPAGRPLTQVMRNAKNTLRRQKNG